MGIAKNISATEWPKQGDYLGRRCRVCFKYDTSQEVMGTIVRDDAEEPCLTIIRLDDGRVVLATECMFAPEASAQGFLTNHVATGKQPCP